MIFLLGGRIQRCIDTYGECFPNHQNILEFINLTMPPAQLCGSTITIFHGRNAGQILRYSVALQDLHALCLRLNRKKMKGHHSRDRANGIVQYFCHVPFWLRMCSIYSCKERVHLHPSSIFGKGKTSSKSTGWVLGRGYVIVSWRVPIYWVWGIQARTPQRVDFMT